MNGSLPILKQHLNLSLNSTLNESSMPQPHQIKLSGSQGTLSAIAIIECESQLVSPISQNLLAAPSSQISFFADIASQLNQLSTQKETSGETISPIPQIKNNTNQKDKQESPLPNFSALKMNQYFFRFVKSVTILVELYQYIVMIVQFKDPKLSILIGSVATILIHTIELAPFYLPLAFVIYLFFNLYYHRQYTPRKREIGKNMRMIQVTMGFSSQMFQNLARFERQILFWNNSQLTMRLVVDLCKISIMGLMMTIFAPTKLVLIIGLWIGLLHKLSFIRHFGNVILGKIRIIALKLIEAVVRKWCKIQRNLMIPQIEVPLIGVFQEFINKGKKQQNVKNQQGQIKNREVSTSSFSLSKSMPQQNAQSNIIMPQNRTPSSSQSNSPRKKTKHQIIQDKMRRASMMSQIKKLNSAYDSRTSIYNESQIQSNLSQSIAPSERQYSVYSQQGKHCIKKAAFQRDQFIIQQQIEEQQIQQNKLQNEHKTPTSSTTSSKSIINNHNPSPGVGGISRIICTTYQNQRWWLGSSWSSMLFPGERKAWSDKSGEASTPKEKFQLPGNDWVWQDIWHVVKINTDCDGDGWQYANDFNSEFSSEHSTFNYVRRRKWERTCAKRGVSQN